MPPTHAALRDDASSPASPPRPLLKAITSARQRALRRTDFYDGPKPTLQSDAGYIDARPPPPIRWTSAACSTSTRAASTSMEQIFEKLGVENRASAAAVTIAELNASGPSGLGVCDSCDIHSDWRAQFRMLTISPIVG